MIPKPVLKIKGRKIARFLNLIDVLVVFLQDLGDPEVYALQPLLNEVIFRFFKDFTGYGAFIDAVQVVTIPFFFLISRILSQSPIGKTKIPIKLKNCATEKKNCAGSFKKEGPGKKEIMQSKQLSRE